MSSLVCEERKPLPALDPPTSKLPSAKNSDGEAKSRTEVQERELELVMNQKLENWMRSKERLIEAVEAHTEAELECQRAASEYRKHVGRYTRFLSSLGIR